jgi:serpin B
MEARMLTHNCHAYTRRNLLKLGAALPTLAVAVDPLPAWALQATPSTPSHSQHAAIAELVAGNSVFALDLYAVLRDTVVGNLLVSPYSISQALAMTYAGARGDTATQMQDVLSFTLPQPALHEAFAALNADLIARGNADASEGDPERPRTLAIANALWLEQTYPFDPAYTAALAPAYGPALHQADFAHRPEEMREEINSWVEDHTEDRIQDIVPADAIDEGTIFAIVNAIYFYGAWRRGFDPADTADDAFHLLDGTAVTVPFMVQQELLPYIQGEGYRVIEFPYAGSDFALTIVLPDAGRFDQVEAELDAGMLEAAAAQLAWAEVRAYLPKFELTFGTIDLKETLKTLGMVDAFDRFEPGQADFTGMVVESALVPPQMPPMIGFVLHQAFIGVSEEGTEAAAATVVTGSPVGAPAPVEPIEVRIDRPFLFAIRDTVTGTLLFLGRMLNPSG